MNCLPHTACTVVAYRLSQKQMETEDFYKLLGLKLYPYARTFFDGPEAHLKLGTPCGPNWEPLRAGKSIQGRICSPLVYKLVLLDNTCFFSLPVFSYLTIAHSIYISNLLCKNLLFLFNMKQAELYCVNDI